MLLLLLIEMESFLSQKNTVAKRIFAGLLTIWMSGLLFVFCCEMPKAQASTGENCPLAKKGYCAKTSDKSSSDSVSVSAATSDILDCCRFLSLFFNKNRTIEQSPSIALLSPRLKIKSAAFFPLKNQFDYLPDYRAPFFKRTNVYLTNCVFRI